MIEWEINTTNGNTARTLPPKLEVVTKTTIYTDEHEEILATRTADVIQFTYEGVVKEFPTDGYLTTKLYKEDIMDEDVSDIQVSKLEEALGVKVCDLPLTSNDYERIYLPQAVVDMVNNFIKYLSSVIDDDKSMLAYGYYGYFDNIRLECDDQETTEDVLRRIIPDFDALTDMIGVQMGIDSGEVPIGILYEWQEGAISYVDTFRNINKKVELYHATPDSSHAVMIASYMHYVAQRVEGLTLRVTEDEIVEYKVIR